MCALIVNKKGIDRLNLCARLLFLHPRNELLSLFKRSDALAAICYESPNRTVNPAQSIFCVEESQAVNNPEEGSNATVTFGGLVGCGLGWFDRRLVSPLIPELPR